MNHNIPHRRVWLLFCYPKAIQAIEWPRSDSKPWYNCLCDPMLICSSRILKIIAISIIMPLDPDQPPFSLEWGDYYVSLCWNDVHETYRRLSEFEACLTIEGCQSAALHKARVLLQKEPIRNLRSWFTEFAECFVARCQAIGLGPPRGELVL